MTSIYPGSEGGVRVDPDVPVEATLKRGILRSVETLTKTGCYTFEQIRRSTVNALDLLTQVDTRRPSIQNRPSKKTHKTAFFSSRKPGLVAFASHKGRHVVRRYPMDDFLLRQHQLSSKHQANKKCEEDIIKFLASYPADEVEEWILEAVVQILLGAEDFEGAFIDIFKAQQPLFRKLRRVYERANKDSIDSMKGCYSNAIAVEAYLAGEAASRQEELSPEEELRRAEDASFLEG